MVYQSKKYRDRIIFYCNLFHFYHLLKNCKRQPYAEDFSKEGCQLWEIAHNTNFWTVSTSLVKAWLYFECDLIFFTFSPNLIWKPPFYLFSCNFELYSPNKLRISPIYDYHQLKFGKHTGLYNKTVVIEVGAFTSPKFATFGFDESLTGGMSRIVGPTLVSANLPNQISRGKSSVIIEFNLNAQFKVWLHFRND